MSRFVPYGDISFTGDTRTKNIFIDMNNIKMEIPDYLSIKDWKYFNSLEHLSTTDKMIAMVSELGGIDEDELKKYKSTKLTKTYTTLLEAFQDLTPAYYPVFELDGVLYGYNPMTKMTLGEYVDIERLASKSHDNMEEIMAILYRPITKNRFSGLKWAYKSATKIALGEAENLFKYYEVEEYDSSKRSELAEKLKHLPASIGLGALSFFFASRKQCLSKFTALFSQSQGADGDDEGTEQTNGYNEHWGWFATIYHLSTTSILSITGQKSITDLNFIFVLNFLAFEQDKNQREDQARKQQERINRIR